MGDNPPVDLDNVFRAPAFCWKKEYLPPQELSVYFQGFYDERFNTPPGQIERENPPLFGFGLTKGAFHVLLLRRPYTGTIRLTARREYPPRLSLSWNQATFGQERSRFEAAYLADLGEAWALQRERCTNAALAHAEATHRRWVESCYQQHKQRYEHWLATGYWLGGTSYLGDQSSAADRYRRGNILQAYLAYKQLPPIDEVAYA